MSKQRRTADDFVRDMKAKQQHSTIGDIERKTSEGQSDVPLTPDGVPLTAEQAAWRSSYIRGGPFRRRADVAKLPELLRKS
jgi:hypothetical protein